MGLEDFEKQLAEEKSHSSSHKSRHSHHDKDSERRHRHHHHHRSSKNRERDDDERERKRHRRDEDEDRRHHRHHHKRRRDHSDDREERHHRKRQKSESPSQPAEQSIKVFDSDPEASGDNDEWVEKEAVAAPPEEDILDQRDQAAADSKPQRDAWMQEPSGLDFDYVQRNQKKQSESKSYFVGATEDHGMKIRESEVSQHLTDLQRDLESDGDEEGEQEQDRKGNEAVVDEPAQHEVNYTFGDSGSSWRMTKLRAVFRQAEESGRSADDIALERYGDLREFDDAREEEREMERRRMYGKEYVGLEKPSGELFQERKMKAGIRRESSANKTEAESAAFLPQGKTIPEDEPSAKTAVLDATALNKLKAQMMKAKLRNAPNAAQLEEEYKVAEAASLANTKQPDVVVLNNMENRMLAGGRGGEVTAVSGKRGRERGLVEENEDMSIEDMVRQEKRTRGGGAGNEGRAFAERIAKDGKFVDNLDYMDDNATRLSKKVLKTDSSLRNSAIEDFQRTSKILASCPLCHHEESSTPPVAPIVSLATRTYLTLPTQPEVVPGGAVIVPVTHHLNLLHADDDEWEEIRNFMKSLTRFYAASDQSVIFYENAAHMGTRRGHAALVAVPMPHHIADTAPAYFKEALLAQAETWSQHRPIIDTAALAAKPGYGKWSFRRSMVKEMPYFHVFFSLDGGLGHVVEDEKKWPRGDMFAREVLGGMVDAGMEIVKKQGRWDGGDRDRKRVEAFRKKWSKWDWTAALVEQDEKSG